METRRGFFSVFGAGTAATAAALNLPEPQNVESLKSGGIYALSFDCHLSDSLRDNLVQALKPFSDKTGCEFLLLDKGVTIHSLDGAPTPEIVDAVDARIGGNTNGARVFLNDIDISDGCVRAEVFSDGRGVAYCFKKDPIGNYIIDATGRSVITESRIGRLRIVRS